MAEHVATPIFAVAVTVFAVSASDDSLVDINALFCMLGYEPFINSAVIHDVLCHLLHHLRSAVGAVVVLISARSKFTERIAAHRTRKQLHEVISATQEFASALIVLWVNIGADKLSALYAVVKTHTLMYAVKLLPLNEIHANHLPLVRRSLGSSCLC